MNRISFTMPNTGFKHVATHGKILLVTFEYQDQLWEMRSLAVFGIPATAVKGLTWQNVFHYQREQLPQWLLDAIDSHCEREIREMLEKCWSKDIWNMPAKGRTQ